MAAPAFVAVTPAFGWTSSGSVDIPESASVGDRLVIPVTIRMPIVVSNAPAGLSLVGDGSDSESGGGLMLIYTGVVTSGGDLDPGATLTFTFSGNTPYTMPALVYQPSDVLAITVLPHNNDSVSSRTTPSLTALGEGTVLHFYGDLSTSTSPAGPVTWTAHGSTTERVDVGHTPSGTNRITTVMVADEVQATAGATPTRTATPSENVRGHGAAMLLGSAVAQPTADAGPDQSVAIGAQDVQLAGTASGGAGAPFTHTWRIVSDTTGGAALSATNVEDPTLDVGATPGQVVCGYICTDSADVPSTEDTVTIAVLGSDNTARPITDITTTGWVKEPPGAASIADTLSDDIDDTYAAFVDPAGAVLEVGLSGLTPPGEGQPVTVWYRASIFEAASGSVVVTLKQGASTVIATWAADAWSADDVVQMFSHELTSGQVAAITDWDDLRLRWEGSVS